MRTYMPLFKKIFLILCVISLSACAGNKDNLPEYLAHEIRDVRKIPQEPLHFYDELSRKEKKVLLLSEEESEKALDVYLTYFFKAWETEKVSKSNLAYFKGKLSVPYGRRGYAENLQKWTDTHFALLADNAQYDLAPSLSHNAIVTTNTSLRIAPTNNPYFLDVKKAADGYPFDMFQNSAIAIGVPIKVFHVSKDRQWYYVENANAAGWVLASHIAFVSDAFQEKWQESKGFVACIKDETLLEDDDIKSNINIGSLFPLVKEKRKEYIIALPYRNTYGMAEFAKIEVSKEEAAQMPMPFNAENMATLINPLIGNLYGWGGLYGNRDCSSTMQDAFTPFGIYLPRNSKGQGSMGEVISLKGLSLDDKEKVIRENAIPFQTLIYMPGHIGLYVGQYKKKALMFHNMWGIRLVNDERYVVGKTVITTLYPGMEQKGAVAPLMERVQSINHVAK